MMVEFVECILECHLLSVCILVSTIDCRTALLFKQRIIEGFKYYCNNNNEALGMISVEANWINHLCFVFRNYCMRLLLVQTAGCSPDGLLTVH